MSGKQNTTPYLPFMQAYFRGRKNVSVKENIRREFDRLRSLEFREMRQVFSRYIPSALFKRDYDNIFVRNRIYSLEITFWAFLTQVLAGICCSQTVKRVQSWFSLLKRKNPSSNTGGYCRARLRLPVEFLNEVFLRSKSLSGKERSGNYKWHGRDVKVVDGTCLSMPDTKENQKTYPQNSEMKEGCGFPQLVMTAVFSLGTGLLLGSAQGNKHFSEGKLFKSLWKLLHSGDIVLGDRGFCSYSNIAALLNKKVDCVFRLHAARKINFRNGIKLGEKDRIFTWKKPASRHAGWTQAQWKKLPKYLKIRILEIPVHVKGFRSNEIRIATTLLDNLEFSPAELGKLYMRRWSVELFLRDIKTAMGMDILKSKSPEQIDKEIIMHAIAYNVIRRIMIDSSQECGISLEKISFSSTVQQLNEWLPLFLNKTHSIGQLNKLFKLFLKNIVAVPLIKRQGRYEPRAKKRRPKNYKLLNKPRKKMIIDCHRSRPERKNAFYKLK